MARGQQYGAYVSDNGTTFAMRVSDNAFADAARGWSTPAAGTVLCPRGMKRRRAHGVSLTTGRRATAICATAGADLYTGAATTFDGYGDDGTLDTYTVTATSGEFLPKSH